MGSILPDCNNNEKGQNKHDEKKVINDISSTENNNSSDSFNTQIFCKKKREHPEIKDEIPENSYKTKNF